MSGFLQALPHLLEFEGGFSDHPSDRGGATNKGVTQGTYDAWRDRWDMPRRSVREITDIEAQNIYHVEYWTAGKCDAFRWPLSLVHFDTCVHSGTVTAAKVLQRALGVADDGVIGPVTMSASENALSVRDQVMAQCLERLDFLRGIANRDATQRVFVRGWLNRVIDLWSIADPRPGGSGGDSRDAPSMVSPRAA